jgi:predicted lysophospholipase L1 biosynthesis ABC-type transport system permease subunit
MPSNPLSDPNWAPQLADTIERVVGTVRDKTTRPVIMAARGVVFGLIAAFVGVFALVIALIGLLRGVQAIIEWPTSHETSVWVSYLVVGGLFCLAGAFLMSKRNPKEAP